MHRSNLGRETRNLLSKAILERENNASFLKPQLIVQKKPCFHLTYSLQNPQIIISSFHRVPSRRRRVFLGKLWEATLIVQSSGVLNSKAPHVAAWLVKLQGSHGSSVLLYYRLGVGGKKPEVDVFFIQKRGGKG